MNNFFLLVCISTYVRNAMESLNHALLLIMHTLMNPARNLIDKQIKLYR